jgi:hypothetical protein
MPQNSELIELAERTPAYGGMMDTAADATTGDVRLSKAALGKAKDLDLLDLMRSWGNIFDQAEQQHTPEARSLGALATRNLQMLALIESISLQNDSGANESASVQQAERELHDYFEPGLYKSALWAKIDTIQALDLPAELEAARALVLDELYMYYDSIPMAPVAVEKPTERTLKSVNRWIEAQYEDVFDAIPECEGGEKLSDEQIAAHFRLVIASTPVLQAEGWVVEIVERSKRVVSVYPKERKIVITKGYEATPQKLMKLDIHEVLGHALRSGVAAALGNDIGAIGTATYSSFEESFMMVLEQCAEERYDPSRGVEHYMAIGMAAESHASAQTIGRVFRSMGQLEKADHTSIDAMVVTAADKSATGQLRRTFAGMMDMDDGVAHMKDIDYLHGINGAWKLLNYLVENDALDEGMKWLLSAKFNPYDEDDRELINHYVSMPTCLNDFFEPMAEVA